MAFRFCESMVHSYRTDGYVILRGILPPSLLSDLRRASSRVHQLAREQGGPAAQRLQPLIKYLSEDELKPFRAYREVPALVDAVHRVLSPEHVISCNPDMPILGVLVEPAELPNCTAWHRDARETSNVPDVAEFRRIATDPLWFVQVNCPLYEDNCTWFVPGSHLRLFDLESETAAANARANTPGNFIQATSASATYADLERANLEYCKAMPRAIRACMDAGDFMLYHPLAWHLGNYVPDRKRVTIHDVVQFPPSRDWRERWMQSLQKKRAAAALA